MLRWSIRENMLDLEFTDRFKRLDNDTFLLLRSGRVDRLGVECGNDMFTFSVLAYRKEVARRFRQLVDTENKQDSEYDLETDGKPPRNRGVDVGKTKVNPVCDNCDSH